MASDEEILEHYILSRKYLLASELNLKNDLFEPALFNGIHALELAVKSVLLTVMDEPITTHNVGGKLGFHFRDVYGEEPCRKVNRILIRYNAPRYPGIDDIDPEDVREMLGYIGDFIDEKVRRTLIERKLLR